MMTKREKWTKYLAGEDVGPMVSPLCDKWGAAEKYKWEGPGPEPFGPDEKQRSLCGQIMMAKTFGWDPLFLAAINFHPINESIEPAITKEYKSGKLETVSTIRTPSGDLTHVEEDNGITTRSLKDYLEDESDYEKMLWYTAQAQDFDRESALAEGLRIREATGDLGMLGTWVSPSVFLTGIQTLYYHLMDYPKAFAALRDARRALQKEQLKIYREAGFDYLFYCIAGTDSISPGFLREWMAEEIIETIAWWKNQGGFIVWHSCGHVRTLIEQGVYNEMLPDVFETLSEPPVGDIPSLAWARERLDPRIITKGNIPLNIPLEGTPEDVREAVRRVKKSTAGSRHIIGLSDNVLNDTPGVNLHAYVEEGYAQ
jgi:hypothetical protein